MVPKDAKDIGNIMDNIIMILKGSEEHYFSNEPLLRNYVTNAKNNLQILSKELDKLKIEY